MSSHLALLLHETFTVPSVVTTKAEGLYEVESFFEANTSQATLQTMLFNSLCRQELQAASSQLAAVKTEIHSNHHGMSSSFPNHQPATSSCITKQVILDPTDSLLDTQISRNAGPKCAFGSISIRLRKGRYGCGRGAMVNTGAL